MIPSAVLTSLLIAGVTANVSPHPIAPSHDSAEENANPIFNAIHSAGRQWGSSFYHNGFSFFPAVMPKGTLMYHGAHQNQTPPGPEWLAFEIEHAEAFAGSRRGGYRGHPIGKRPGDNKPPEDGREELKRTDEEDTNYRGYLHVYQANRDLKLLLIDGMSAGKTTMGTLDSQDLLLRENSTKDGSAFGEWSRAEDLCDLMTDWGYDGVVRMEVGFEVIYCNFSTGVDLVSMTRTLMWDDRIGNQMMDIFDWTRAVAERYNGIGGDRLRIDYSSMVSGLFFPINISSIDTDRPDLVRLAAANLDDLKGIKSYLREVATKPRRFIVNWQALVDMIVARFSKRLATLGSTSVPWYYFVDEIDSITLTWFDAPPLPEDATMAEENRTAEAISRCRKHFLRPAVVFEDDWSDEDELIFTAVDIVIGKVCNDLFIVRNILLDADSKTGGYRLRREEDDEELDKAVSIGRTLVQDLMTDLGWTTWRQPQQCPVDEVLFIAMWPFGDEDDHWHPGCKSIDRMKQREDSYWRMDFGEPPKRRPDEREM
ncbi:Fc.00g031580.m01.CDS01 [Cosmosporella sp. VM-42]